MYVIMHCTNLPDTFLICPKAASQMVAFPVSCIKKYKFSDVSEKLGVFKFQDP
jgi:hypothetical protein